jgi:outer membrane protein OmpA-like peptidoglycan-associated protein
MLCTSPAAFPRVVLLATLAGGTILAGQSSLAGRPLRQEPGLVVVSAINDRVMGKDYEAVGTFQTVDASGVRSVTDWAIPDRQAPDGVRRQSAPSMERAEDVQHARHLILWYQPGDPETIPGATGPTPSVDVFTDIQTRGEAPVVIGAASTSDTKGLGPLGGFFTARKYFRGTMKKLGVEPVRVLVDGVPTALNTVHVGGTVTVGSDSGDVAFWWLDDREARFALRFSFQGSVSQVVRIDRPKSGELLGGLATGACRSDVPGIYFLTDSAELLPASQPAVQRIAATLRAHSDWTITIEGHTDNTGSDQHNIDLSKRRAESLKNELTAKYGVSATRLQTAGYGRTRPVDTNDTLDGRAHNRRVEISRRC